MKPLFRGCLFSLMALFLPWSSLTLREAPKGGREGYYRFPALHGDTIVFTAEGDLWKVHAEGGTATRLTSHPGEESHAAFSPDGTMLAFSAQYEGPTEVYTMPAQGGLPTRQTFEGEGAVVQGWTPDGNVLYATRHFSTLPDWQLATANPKTGLTAPLPLSQAADGVFDPENHTLFFTRQWFQGSSTKRYKGGTAQDLWKFSSGSEAAPLTPDFAGTSKSPMLWHGRVYFISDRDGTMNIWSMNEDGADLRQLTTHRGWDVKDASLDEGHIVYQDGADLWLYDIASEKDALVPVTLASDFDQEREKWVKKPMDYLTAAHLSPDGDRLVLTARGQVFVAPSRSGRLVDVTREPPVRYRQARFMPDGKTLLALSDQTGELEFNTLPANGVGEPEPISHDGKIFRFDGVSSPDGKWVAYQDKNQKLWLLDLKEHESRLVATSKVDSFQYLRWSPDSRWLAYVASAENLYAQIWLYHLADSSNTALTSDRINSYSPVWSPDGKWVYFLSDRHLQSVVGSPWGPRQPEPFFNESVKIYLVSLLKDGRSPFAPPDELHPEKKKEEKKARASSEESKREHGHEESKREHGHEESKGNAEEAVTKSGETNKTPSVHIDLDGLQARVTPVPVSAGNYSGLGINDKNLFWLERAVGASTKLKLTRLEITNEDPKPKELVNDLRDYELSLDGKKVMIQKGQEFYVVDANDGTPLKLEKAVDLNSWTFLLAPREEWRQMFVESWRLMRDYFYDPNMHGVNWPAVRDKYLPLTGRVTAREELSDLIADMVGELSALHIFVRGGDFREGPDEVAPSGLGAALSRDETQGGYRVRRIYRADPDYPESQSPLARPGVDVREGAIIQKINGVSVLSVPHPAALLRNQAAHQVLLSIKPSESESARDVVVTPMSVGQESDLRYDDWEYSRRMEVENMGNGEIGYVHLRAMGSRDIAAWARDFYPVFNRKGLIIDVRHNSGGNIDSWILEKLCARPGSFGNRASAMPIWNMQYAFRGHVVVLCDEHTASDGEAFSEGFKRLPWAKSLAPGLGEARSGSRSTMSWSIRASLPRRKLVFTARKANGSSKGMGLTQTSSLTTCLTQPSKATTLNSKPPSLNCRRKSRPEPVTVPSAPAHPDKSFK